MPHVFDMPDLLQLPKQSLRSEGAEDRRYIPLKLGRVLVRGHGIGSSSTLGPHRGAQAPACSRRDLEQTHLITRKTQRVIEASPLQGARQLTRGESVGSQ